jgi:hypothetical protein
MFLRLMLILKAAPNCAPGKYVRWIPQPSGANSLSVWNNNIMLNAIARMLSR